jgi:hypothetical protein
MASNAKTIAELLNGDVTVTATDIADDAVTTNKLATQTGDVDFADNSKIRLGTGNDLQIYHNGSNSYVQDAGTGNLNIITNGGELALLTQGGLEYGVRIIQDGAVEIRHDDSTKLATTATGVSVTGDLTIAGSGTGVYLGGTGNANKLDDYEEGVYQPTLTGSTSGSAAMRAGYEYLAYTKIGRLVTVTGRWETTGGHNIVGNVKMSLPFAQSGSLSSQAETGVGTMSLNRTGTNFDQTNLFQTVTFAAESQLYIYYQPSGTGNEAIVQGSQLDSAFEGYVHHTFLAENQ